MNVPVCAAIDSLMQLLALTIWGNVENEIFMDEDWTHLHPYHGLQKAARDAARRF
jgi:hypothetical protein